jgi:dCMP deaminase
MMRYLGWGHYFEDMTMTTLSKWDTRFLALAQHVSSWSKDPSTKVGAVIARDKTEISMGYNGFPSRIEDHSEFLNYRPTKYRYVIHGEMNAILKAGREGRDINGATLYLFPLPPCAECAKHIVAAGISRVVVQTNFVSDAKARYARPSLHYVAEEWRASEFQDFSDTKEILTLAGVQYSGF